MPQSIYMNNFRGFTDTTILLKKVNFFVGENSTGKTSLLALLELLASRQFWFSSFNFNAGTYEFGGYKDIVSVLSSDKAEFQIGHSAYDAKNPKTTLVAYMLHFHESKDGLPELERFSLLSAKCVATVRVLKDQFEIYSSSYAAKIRARVAVGAACCNGVTHYEGIVDTGNGDDFAIGSAVETKNLSRT